VSVQKTKSKKMKRHLLLITFAMVCVVSSGNAQTTLPYFTYGKGLGITAPDSTFSINLRFRIQNRALFKTTSTTDLAISEVEARVRRARLRFDGFVWSPKLTYTLQLSFSRGDMDYESLNFPNVVRDAYVQYALFKNFSVGIGQTKLPGNRQRVNSSGDLQFYDRSIVNAAFTIDRDFGVQFHYKTNHLALKGAISSGEGRNISASDNGLAYTGRAEWLPFGTFTNGGDYFEGDLAREKKPKISIGLAYSHNEKAVRTGGQLGSMLYASTDIKTQIIDFIYKHKGWSLAAEYIERQAPNAVTTNADGNTRFVYVGYGQNVQGGYVFKNNVELVGRYSFINPGNAIGDLQNKTEQYTIGANKYLKGHRVKLQNSITQERVHDDGSQHKSWIYCFQVELGI
jgi:phosphate-selective porin OprO/OprP